MKLNVTFAENSETVNVNFEDKHADMYKTGYDVGYTAGYESGKTAWYTKGYADGEAAGLERGREEGRAEGFEQGRIDGYADGYTKGLADGKQEMHIAFWKSITNNNTKTEYSRAFKNWYIDTAVFRPPTTLNCGGISNELFYNATSTDGLDMQTLEEELGYPILDTSKATNLSYAFFSSAITTLGVIDLSLCTNTDRMLYNPAYYAHRVRSIKKLIVSRTTDFNYAFHYATGLEHCIFEGTIGKNGLDMKHCTNLDFESLNSIINCLSTTTSGLTVTVSRTAVTNAFQEDPLLWTNAVNSKPNWTINLA